MFVLAPLFLLGVVSACSKNEPAPAADFAYAGTNAFIAPATVQFTNLSTRSFSYEWWFDADSSLTTTSPAASSLKDPAYLFRKPGQYVVRLRAYTQSRKEWATLKKTIIIKDSIR